MEVKLKRSDERKRIRRKGVGEEEKASSREFKGQKQERE